MPCIVNLICHVQVEWLVPDSALHCMAKLLVRMNWVEVYGSRKSRYNVMVDSFLKSQMDFHSIYFSVS